MNTKGSFSRSICPLCKGKGTPVSGVSCNVHQEQFWLYRCGDCHLSYTVPFPSPELLKKIYSEGYWMDSDEEKNIGNQINLIRQFNIFRFAVSFHPLFKRLNAGNRILEIGCGGGELAVYLKKKGYVVEVTDIDRRRVDFLVKSYGMKGYVGDFLEDGSFFPADYHAIILNNVLEHLHNPLQVMRKIHRLLGKGGRLY